MKYMIKIWGGLMLMFLAYVLDSCKEEERIKYYDPDAPAPAAINQASVTVENFPGTSIIRYELPDDDNLLYVKAVYETAPGVIRESKASVFIDTLVLEGFGAGGNHIAKLYSVGKNEKESEAISITVSPETPPVITAFATVNLSAVFGGVKGEYRNESNSDLKAVLLIDTLGNGVFQQLRAFVSNDPNSRFMYLGLDSVAIDFAVYLQDRFGNRSDTAWFRGITPLYEELIPKNNWTWYQLPSDALVWSEMAANGNRYAPMSMWDGDLGATVWSNVYSNDVNDLVFPSTLTVSLGDSYALSRLVIHHWGKTDAGYGVFSPKSFQIWGSNLNLPGDDLFGGDWQLLGDFESKIPSGNATPTRSDKDSGVFDGDPFFFEVNDITPNPFVPTKFIRFNFRGNWEGLGIGDPVKICIAEIYLYGQKTESN